MSNDVVHTLEWSRIVAPDVAETADGRRYIEFAPAIETRNIVCDALADGAYDCRFDSRVRGAFEREFSEWTPRRERLVFRRGYWRFD